MGTSLPLTTDVEFLTIVHYTGAVIKLLFFFNLMQTIEYFCLIPNNVSFSLLTWMALCDWHPPSWTLQGTSLMRELSWLF